MNRSSVRELRSLGRSWCIYCVYGIYGYAYMNLLMNACIHVCLNKCIINLLIYHTYCMLILLLHPYLHITANTMCPSLQNYLIRWNGRISEANLGDLFPDVSTRFRVPISLKHAYEHAKCLLRRCFGYIFFGGGNMGKPMVNSPLIRP